MRKMKLISVRKCYFIAKVSLLMILVVSLLGLFEKWRGGKRAASAFSDLEEEYERQILEDEARIIPGLGEGGAAAYLSGVDKLRGEESEKKLAMNVYLSDRISYNRTLKDQRNPACARVVYDAELPSASVILIFHNEPYSVVLRTIWSVINSCRRDQPWFRKANFLDRDGRTMRLGYPGQAATSPLVYLKEIILVDDNSTLPELKGKLSHYVRTRLPPDLIRILRLPDRVGLTRARLAGARYAKGTVLIFLDAHCEAQPDWLRPQLQVIKDSPHAVVIPIIDSIDESNYYYSVQQRNSFQVGGFSFTGHFTWIDVTQQEKKRRGSDISPTWSPTMAGGLFAINRAYYWELGAYDEQMSGWGGENLEMSFRIWQCGGTLETIPCSRVGHVFRSFHPYAMPGNSDTHGINTARMAEVWMDDYAELFYLHRPDLRNNPKIGDVTHRKILREKLQCKSFQWYLDNIYKEKFVPIRDTYGYGRFRNPSTGLCIDTLQREGEDAALGVYACHPDLQATQYYVLSLAHELRDEDSCAHVQFNRHAADEEDTALHKVFKAKCHGKQREQKWVYLPATKQIQHSESQLCLDSGLQGGADLLAKPCSGANTQQWVIDYTEDNDFKLTNGDTPSDQELRLARLRGQRRKSRSLLSVGGSQRRRHHKKHHKRSKKSRAKNKFILKLVRTLVNNTDEHLEVDIHCKHNQLYPNNSFVRDLVTILNERNVKVINNGRVFDHNKVTPLDPKQDEDRKLPSKMAPEEAVQQVKRKARARKHKPSAPGNLLPAEYAPSAPEHAPEHARLASKRERTEHASARTTLTPRSHRIIIEDFIQMTPATLVKNMKRRKRTLAPHTPPALPAAAPEEDGNSIMDVIAQNVDPHTDEQVDLLPPSEEQNESTENAPMASESETHSRAEEKLARDKHKDIDTKLKKMKEYKKKTKEMRERDRDLSTVAERKRHKKERDDEKEKEENDNNIEEAWSVGESRFRAQDHDIRRHRAHTEVPTVKSDDDDLSRRHRAHTEAPTVQSDDDELSRRLRAHTETPTVHADDARRERAHSKASTVQFDDDALYRDESMEEQTTPRPASAASPAAPVKVVMQSNLTFNLGRNFFKWRSNYKNSDDEAPSGARATPVKAWLRGHTRGPEDDVIATGHLEKAVPDVAPASEERSSSSESASAD